MRCTAGRSASTVRRRPSRPRPRFPRTRGASTGTSSRAADGGRTPSWDGPARTFRAPGLASRAPPPPTSLALACWLEPEEETLRTRRLTPHRPSPQRRLRPGHPPVLHHRRGRHSLLVRSSLPGSAHRDPLKGERNRTDMLTVRAPAARSRATRTSSSSRTSRSLRRNPTPSSPIPIAFLQSELGD